MVQKYHDNMSESEIEEMMRAQKELDQAYSQLVLDSFVGQDDDDETWWNDKDIRSWRP